MCFFFGFFWVGFLGGFFLGGFFGWVFNCQPWFQVERLAQLIIKPPEELAAILEVSFTKVRIIFLYRNFIYTDQRSLDFRYLLTYHPASTGTCI
jgi:hypothetical protein